MKIEKQCLTCNKTFQADNREHNRGNAKYCSLSCSAKNQKKEKSKENICVYCESKFLSTSKGAKYCSNHCKIRNYRKRQVTQSYHTSSLQRILGHLPCEICGWKEATRDIHHILPVSKGGKNTLDNVILVCPNHHRMFHHNLVSKEAVETAFKLRLSLHPELFQEQDAQAGN